MVSQVSYVFLIHYILSSYFLAESAITYNVINFGAKPDGKTNATQPFLRAWESACSATQTSTIYVPKGRYLIGAVEFRGPCRSAIEVQLDGTLVAPIDYRALGNSGYWILFIKVNRLLVLGGTLDAKGSGLWECRNFNKNCPIGARSITLNWVNDGEIKGLISVNSQVTHIVINSCNNVRVSNVTLKAPNQSPNTDGIHIQSSSGITITNSIIKTGDDCISIGPGTRNLWIDKIQCGPGHGISIGSLARNYNEDGVQNVTIVNSLLSGSDNGLRIKSWARPSTGFVRNISYRNIVMRNVQKPIIIDQNYCPSNQSCPGQNSGIKIDEVSYKNIKGTSATQIAMIFDCSPIHPCSGIKLQDIKLTYLNTGKAQSFCRNVRGSSCGVILPDNCL